MLYRILFGLMALIMISTVSPLAVNAQDDAPPPSAPLCDDGIADGAPPPPPVSMGMGGDEEADSRTANDGAQLDRLSAPPVSDNPTQLECGAYHYAQVCMACHGDKGQGLTEEWRAAWGTEEQNCWQSKCHAANHPPEGFQLPYAAPAIMGDDALARFNTAADLYGYIESAMPWHAPGSLDEATYWQLTAFLAHSNGAEVPATLDSDTAPRVALRPLATVLPAEDAAPAAVAPAATSAETGSALTPFGPTGYVTLSLFALAALGFVIAIRRR